MSESDSETRIKEAKTAEIEAKLLHGEGSVEHIAALTLLADLLEADFLAIEGQVKELLRQVREGRP